MPKGPAVLGYALLFAVSCGACESGDPDDAHTTMDARVQTPDGSHDDGSTDDAAAGDANCPPECFRAFICAPACGAASFSNGCCPCPAGTIDTITCGGR